MEGRHFQEIRKRLSNTVPENLLPILPEHYELIGDILLLNIPEQLSPYRHELAEAYKDALGASSVMEKRPISGEFREPGHEMLAGTRTVTTHRENGIRYRLDLSKLMFSAGNISERIRMSKVEDIGPVIDMFAGIGYFSLPLAKHVGSRVVALEKNPVSYEYLKQNIALNRLQDRIVPYNMDCRDYTNGGAKRIVMGYVRTTDEYLDKAFSLSGDGCVVHFHQTVPADGYDVALLGFIEGPASRNDAEIEVIGTRVVKKYSPGIVHAVMDFRIKKY